MRIKIFGTNEYRDLIVLDKEGNDYVEDLLNNDCDYRNPFTSEYTMSIDLFKWWENYIKLLKYDEKEIEKIAKILGIDATAITDKILFKILQCDATEHFDIRQQIIAEFRLIIRERG